MEWSRRSFHVFPVNLEVIPDIVLSQALESIDVDPAQLAAGYAKDGLSVPSLVKLLAEQLPDDAGDYLHWGATSQDIVDSALSGLPLSVPFL